MKQLVPWLRRLAGRYPEASRFVRFGLVGGSGMAVDLSLTALVYRALDNVNVAYAVGIATAMTWNFVWNRKVTFADAKPQPWLRQYVGFCLSCLVGAVVSFLTRELLFHQVAFFHQYMLAAVPVGVLAGMTFNYLLCRHFVFQTDDHEH